MGCQSSNRFPRKRLSRQCLKRAADSDLCFDPGIARCLTKGDKRAHERNKSRRGHFEADFFCRNQMAAFMNKNEKHKNDRKSPARKKRVCPYGNNHGQTSFKKRQQKFQLGEELEANKSYNPNRCKKLFCFLR